MSRLLIIFSALISFNLFASSTSIDEHYFSSQELRSLGFLKIEQLFSSESNKQYGKNVILTYPNYFKGSFIVQYVELEVIAGGNTVLLTVLDKELSEVNALLSSYLTIFNEQEVKYKVSILYDTVEKETPFVRYGHRVILGDIEQLEKVEYLEYMNWQVAQ